MKAIKDIKCFLLDMDGTIYLGNKLIDGAQEFLDKLGRDRYVFLTNNSSRSKKKYLEKLAKLNIIADEDDVFSSADATIMYLKEKKEGASIFLIGTPDLEKDFLANGFDLVRERNQDIDFVVLGFDTSLTYEKMWIACEYLASGIPYIATHPDFNCPLEGGKFMPDIGAMIEFFKASTGREPIIIGKPYKYMVEAIEKKYNLKRDDLAIVGDRLYTDIRTGIDNGLTSVLVLSGETDLEMSKASEYKADYIFESVKDIIKQLD